MQPGSRKNAQEVGIVELCRVVQPFGRELLLELAELVLLFRVEVTWVAGQGVLETGSERAAWCVS